MTFAARGLASTLAVNGGGARPQIWHPFVLPEDSRTLSPENYFVRYLRIGAPKTGVSPSGTMRLQSFAAVCMELDDVCKVRTLAVAEAPGGPIR
jgi:hypothetical protein